MVCFPVLAQASESSELQYETDVPKVEGETKSPINHPKGKNNSQANSSSTGDSGSQSSGGKSDPESSSKDSSRDNNPSTGGSGGGGQGGSGNGSTGPDLGQEATPVSTTSSDGGSSPLVPILIAIAALAAITIGAVVMRQRRDRDGVSSPVSPKAR